MSNYLLLFIGGSEPQGEEELARYVQAWETWFATLGDRVVDEGNAFTPRIKSVTARGEVSEGPVGARATGYAIISADSPDAAAEIARACPHLQADGEITVYEVYAEV